METTKKQSSHWWWFDSHNNNSPARSQWLQSTLSVLDEKTEEMLRIIEEDADSFSQRAEMYYKKRPQLVGMVEDFYRAHRSLAEQFDHLRHEPGTRRTSPLARSFSLKMDQQEKEVLDPPKSYESEDSSEKSLDLVKPFEGCYTDLAYDSDEYVDSEVDDPILEAKDEAIDMGKVLMSAPMNHQDLIDEIERLKEENLIQKKQLMEKDNNIGELKLKLSETANEIKTLREEAGKLRMENVEMYLQKIKEAEERDVMAMNLKKEKEQLIVENSTLNKLLIQKDKETREAMKLSETATEVKTLREEAGKLRMENVEMCLQKINEAEERDMMAMNLKKEMEQLVVKNSTLNKLLIQKDKETREAMKLSETATEVKTLRKEAGKLRMENVEMYLQKIKEAEERDMLAMNLKKEKEQLIVENSTLNKLLIQKDEETRKEMEVKCVERKKVENEVGVLLMEIKEQREMLEEKDEGKREAIRQLSLAIEMLKGENRLLKKTIVNGGSNKKWNPFELQVLKGFGKLINCSIMSSKPSVVPL